MSDEYAFTDDEVAKLTRAFAALVGDVGAGSFGGRGLDQRILCALHRRLFDGVRGHCGRMRSASWGPDRVVLYGCGSEHRRDVDTRVSRVLDFLRRLTGEEDVEDLYQALGWACVELVRIQPFVDGNKRTSILFIMEMTRRLGLPPLDFTRQWDRFLEAAGEHVRGTDRSGKPMARVLALATVVEH